MARIGLDIDDTSAKYLKGLRNAIERMEPDFFTGMTREEIDAHFPSFRTFDDFHWTLLDNDREKFVDYHSRAVEDGLFVQLEPMDGVTEYVQRLHDDGHDIYIITSRFVKNGQNARVLSDTGMWLDLNNIPYKDIMFVRDKTDVVADVYIDDSPKNLNALRAAGRQAIAFDRSYNRDMEGLRAANWAEAYSVITEVLSR